MAGVSREAPDLVAGVRAERADVASALCARPPASAFDAEDHDRLLAILVAAVRDRPRVVATISLRDRGRTAPVGREHAGEGVTTSGRARTGAEPGQADEATRAGRWRSHASYS